MCVCVSVRAEWQHGRCSAEWRGFEHMLYRPEHVHFALDTAILQPKVHYWVMSKERWSGWAGRWHLVHT